jgi:hypothetical protein
MPIDAITANATPVTEGPLLVPPGAHPVMPGAPVAPAAPIAENGTVPLAPPPRLVPSPTAPPMQYTP